MGRYRKNFNDEIWCHADVCNQEWDIQLSICKEALKALKSREPCKRGQLRKVFQEFCSSFTPTKNPAGRVNY